MIKIKVCKLFIVFCNLAKKLQKIIDKHQIITDLKTYLHKNYSKSVKDVVLFGSKARGDSSKDSDYDILIVLNKNYS